MIRKETAGDIWECYREIEVSEKLMSNMKEACQKGEDPNPVDPFGRRQCLQMGVPCGDSAQRLFKIEPKLALSVISAHIANKRKELVEANERARIELEHTDN